MKTIKFLFFLIILGLCGLLGYQNLDYFTMVRSFHIDLKINEWQYTIPELPNYVFWGFCFVLGLLLTGIKGMATAFRLGREIKRKDAHIEGLVDDISDLKRRLDVFIHDPYIKNHLDTREGETVPEEKPKALPEPSPEPEAPVPPENADPVPETEEEEGGTEDREVPGPDPETGDDTPDESNGKDMGPEKPAPEPKTPKE